jgi:hypothetical protein
LAIDRCPAAITALLVVDDVNRIEGEVWTPC